MPSSLSSHSFFPYPFFRFFLPFQIKSRSYNLVKSLVDPCHPHPVIFSFRSSKLKPPVARIYFDIRDFHGGSFLRALSTCSLTRDWCCREKKRSLSVITISLSLSLSLLSLLSPSRVEFVSLIRNQYADIFLPVAKSIFGGTKLREPKNLGDAYRLSQLQSSKRKWESIMCNKNL